MVKALIIGGSDKAEILFWILGHAISITLLWKRRVRQRKSSELVHSFD